MKFTPEEQSGFRFVLDSKYQNMSSEDLDDLVSTRLTGLSENQIEDISTVAKEIGKIAAPVITGLTAGAAVGGPVGAVVGAIGGGVTGVLAGKSATQSAPPPVTPTVASPVTSTSPGSNIRSTKSKRGSRLTMGSACAHLLRYLQNPPPLFLQSLLSLVFGSDGSKVIQGVAPGDVLNLLNTLIYLASKEAAEAHATKSEDISVSNSDENLDPANSDDRAEALMDLLDTQEQSFKETGQYQEGRLGRNRKGRTLMVYLQ